MPAGSPASCAENGVAALTGPMRWAAVLCPYAVVVPNWNDTATAAPRGFTLAETVACDVPTPVAAPLTGASGSYALANSPRGVVPWVVRKNGVPSAPPWQAAPSPLNGVAMQPEEIGWRMSAWAVGVIVFRCCR